MSIALKLLPHAFIFGAEVRGCAAHSKYLVQIDRLLNRASDMDMYKKRYQF